MDPTENLKEQTRIAEAILRGIADEADSFTIAGDAYDLAQAVLDLNTWITNGGFLPEPWQAARDRASRLANRKHYRLNPEGNMNRTGSKP